MGGLLPLRHGGGGRGFGQADIDAAVVQGHADAARRPRPASKTERLPSAGVSRVPDRGATGVIAACGVWALTDQTVISAASPFTVRPKRLAYLCSKRCRMTAGPAVRASC